MKYFLDAEFIEKPNTIELISLGLICEDGKGLYAENIDFNENNANEWVKINVLPNLKFIKFPGQFCFMAKDEQGDINVHGTISIIKDQILDFILDDVPEFWGYYSDYDWVIFCWIFGTMVDLPKGWPMYCNDIKQFAVQSGIADKDLPKQKSVLHNALSDAEYNMKVYDYIIERNKDKRYN